jgi:hypothetical protein
MLTLILHVDNIWTRADCTATDHNAVVRLSAVVSFEALVTMPMKAATQQPTASGPVTRRTAVAINRAHDASITGPAQLIVGDTLRRESHNSYHQRSDVSIPAWAMPRVRRQLDDSKGETKTKATQ